MLNYLVVQTIVEILTFVFALAARILMCLYEEYEKTVLRVVGWIFGGLAIACAIYYLCDVLWLNCNDLTSVKIIVFAVSGLLWFGSLGVGNDEGRPVMISTIMLILAIIMILVCACAFAFASNKVEKQAIYDENIIQQSPQVETYKYELIAASDGTNIEGGISGESSGDFFLACGTISSNVNGEIKQTDVYKFYYVANSTTGEIKLMTVNASSTSIFYVEEGEEPYLLKKVSTPYSLDYNVDPPRKCNFGESKIVYELHIPRGSIVGNFEFGSGN